MSNKPKYWNRAKKILSKKDKVMRKLINNYKDKSLITRNDVFYSLCMSITGQQLSISSASAIFKRFQKKVGKITPTRVSKLSISQIKSCGMTKQKAKGIKELAVKMIRKEFNPKLINKMSDEEAIEYLSQLRQIGRWSAEMILLFTFNRSNIWPIQDIGLLRAISKNFNKKYLPPQKFISSLQKKYSPYCSVATWYLWRSIDNDPIQY